MTVYYHEIDQWKIWMRLAHSHLLSTLHISKQLKNFLWYFVGSYHYVRKLRELRVPWKSETHLSQNMRGKLFTVMRKEGENDIKHLGKSFQCYYMVKGFLRKDKKCKLWIIDSWLCMPDTPSFLLSYCRLSWKN